MPSGQSGSTPRWEKLCNGRLRTPGSSRYPASVRYAAYGSNLHPLRLERRGIGARLVGTSRVEGHALHFHKRGQDASGKCNIAGPGDGVYVAVFELNIEHKIVLDRIEGVGNGYDKDEIDVPGHGMCHTYVAQDTHIDEEIEPFDWYRELVIAGSRFHGFPDDYIERLVSTPAVRDHDDMRGTENWLTVEALRSVQ